MKIYLFIFIFIIKVNVYAQPFIPNILPFDTIFYSDQLEQKKSYISSKNDIKAFLFYDISSAPMAEILRSGTKFVFNQKSFVLFPVYFSVQTPKKNDEDSQNEIPIQIVKSPEISMFSKFNLKHEDFPLLVIYNQKNELCGFTKNVQEITSLNCGETIDKNKILRLKILAEEKNKKMNPYSFKPVVIMGLKNNDTVAKLITDKYGDFNVEIPNLEQDYLISVNEKRKDLNFAILASQTGKLIGKFKSTDRGFEYRLLKLELSQLPDIAIEEDIEMKFTVKKINTANNFDVTETLYYEFGEAELTKSSKLLVDKIKKVLDTYPKFRLKIVSHTDSQGDDIENLKLSIKRTQTVITYLISLGVDSNRLSGEGRGEKEIRNRCINNIECSDKEHEFNRRTEFKFYKIQ